jgi:hypothetical protein
MLLLNMLLQRIILVLRLLKDQYGLVFEAEFTEVDSMDVNNVVTQSFFCWKLAGTLH